MKISVINKLSKSDLLLILTPEKNIKKAYGKRLPDDVLKEVETLAKSTSFQDRRGENVRLSVMPKGIRQSFALGMGAVKQDQDYRCCVRNAIKLARKFKVAHVTVALPDQINLERAIGGAFSGNYDFKLGDTKDIHQVQEVTFVTDEKTDTKPEVIFGESVDFTKDLINRPPNYIDPESMVTEIKKMMKGAAKLKLTVLGEKQMKKLKMGSLLGVGQGSDKESQLVVIEYQGGAKKDAPVALIGKGVMFDSGGYNLKPTGHIEDMKCDMAGAATVVGLMHYFAKSKVKKNVIGVVGLVENMVSSGAYKPGDVLTSMSGKTIEVTNTDAEGRLVLADALYYTATKYKPAVMVDFATLTGACMVALGYTISGVMGNDQKVIDQLLKASQSADEEVWPLPLNDYFKEKTKGSISDLYNWTDGVMAGAPMAAAFLSHFVNDVPWAHFDIAGTAFNGKGNSGGAKRATGVLMRTIRQWIETSS